MPKKDDLLVKKEQLNPTPEGVDRVAKLVDLIDITLLETACLRELIDPLTDDYLVQEMFWVDVVESKPVSKRFYAVYHLGVRGIPEEESQNDSLEDLKEFFRIEATYRLTYDLKKRKGIITKHDVLSFVQVNSIIHIWPYWREFVNCQALRMGLPSLTLPIKAPKRELAELIKRDKK